MQQVLSTPAADHGEAVQAWMCLILFDKLVAHSKTDPSMSLNATMRQRLRQAMDGEWLYLASDVLDKWPKRRAAAPTNADHLAATAKRAQSLASRGNFSKAAAAAMATPRGPAPPDEKAKLLAELCHDNSLCPSDSRPLELDANELALFRQLAVARLRKADITASGGLA